MDTNDRNFRFNFSKILIPLLLLLFAMSACQDSTKEMEERPSDSEIAEAVRAQLATTEAVPGEGIEIKAEDGVLTLIGTTGNLLAKKEATKLAQSVRGVLSVINNIKITADRPDEAIQTDIGRAIATDPATEFLEINSRVNNGRVTLTGAVDSWQEKQLAGTIAMGVKGVKGIENAILVEQVQVRPDEEIRNEIETTLKMNSEIRDAQIDVAVDSSKVSLSGAVGSAYEKQLAFDYAHVAGVDSVTADELEVHPEYRSELLQRDNLDILTDEQIRNAMVNAFAYDPRVPADNIEVTIKDDIAILGGMVNNLNSKLAAESDARHTAGLRAVENNIKVRKKAVVEPKIPVTDDAIKSRIELAIERDPYVGNTEIAVSVSKGMATLDGEVSSQFKKKQVEKVASHVKGVLAITNNIQIAEGGNI